MFPGPAQLPSLAVWENETTNVVSYVTKDAVGRAWKLGM